MTVPSRIEHSYDVFGFDGFGDLSFFLESDLPLIFFPVKVI